MSNSNVVPLQPHPIHPLRSLKQLAAKADCLALRYEEALCYEQTEKLMDILREKIEAAATTEQIDALITNARRIVVLREHEETLLAWCEAALQRADPDDAYDKTDDDRYHLKPSVVAARIAVLVGGFPAGAPSDPAVYLKVMMEHVSAADPSLAELDAAIWESVGTLKFIPSVSELMAILKQQRAQWGRRFMAIHNIAEASCWTLEEIEKLQFEAMARCSQTR